jgi:probable F420-dependent oxidoreductase
MRDIRFGLQLRRAPDAAAFIEQVREAERLGYDVVTLPDHFNDQFAPMPALAVAAASTRRIRVGALVFCNDFKHPAVLAKELATLDLLSDGRVEVGLGAGWLAGDYEASGIPYDEPKLRVERFEEGVRIIKALLRGEEPVTFEGRHYQVRELSATPRPVQRPHPPIYIGGGGPRMLAIAGREADIAGVHADLRRGRFDEVTMATLGPDSVEGKVARVREAAGKRFDRLELALVALFVRVTAERERAMGEMAAEYEMPVEVLRDMPQALVGTADAIARQIETQRERWGVTYYTVSHEHMASFAEVIGLLRKRG